MKKLEINPKAIRRDTTLLPAPQINAPNFNGIIDDQFLSGFSDTGVPFLIPAYPDMAINDGIYLLLNGSLVEYFLVKTLGPALPPVYVRVSDFNFSGKSNWMYVVQDVNTQNVSISATSIYVVNRHDYPAPSTGGTLAPPIVKPATYAKDMHVKGYPVEITVRYDPMTTTDDLTVKFELRATTLDHLSDPNLYFYPIPDIPVKLSAADINNKYITISVPASTFDNVDENLGRIYYSVTADTKFFGAESERAVVNIDVVPPQG